MNLSSTTSTTSTTSATTKQTSVTTTQLSTTLSKESVTTDSNLTTTVGPDSNDSKVGLIVGVTVGVVLLLLIIGFFIWRYIKRRRSAPEQMVPAPPDKFKRRRTYIQEERDKLRQRLSTLFGKKHPRQGIAEIHMHPKPPDLEQGQDRNPNDYGALPTPGHPALTEPKYENVPQDQPLELDKAVQPPPDAPDLLTHGYVNTAAAQAKDGYVNMGLNNQNHSAKELVQELNNRFNNNGIPGPEKINTDEKYMNSVIQEDTIRNGGLEVPDETTHQYMNSPMPVGTTSNGVLEPYYANGKELILDELYENSAVAAEQNQPSPYVQHVH